MKEASSSDDSLEKHLDSQLWHACAGGMVEMPPINSKVYYFPQGHVEHVQGKSSSNEELGRMVASLVLCRVASIKFMADGGSDEVYAKLKLVPLGFEEEEGGEEGGEGEEEEEKEEEEEELVVEGEGGNKGGKFASSFSKTLTQSDANNGGGFSVPRYCAETIFPRLDYSADPPVQTVVAKDVHGQVWKFRHIYRGTPRRHLLTTGWSTFVNQKKLVAGDSIVFLRVDGGDLYIGIRRASRRGGVCTLAPPPFGAGGFSMFLNDNGTKMMTRNTSSNVISEGRRMRDGHHGDGWSVVEAAASLAANGKPFEVLYYPRASTPEFCVRASLVRAAMRTHWCSGMRFKMAFETEDSSRISWFMGTILAVQVADPICWPNSPWRLLQVSWDEPDLLQNVKRVSPWLVELVSNMATIQHHHLSPPPFSPQRKKLRVPQQRSEFGLDGQRLSPSSSSLLFPLGPSSSPQCFPPWESTPTAAGIQGARHAHFGISLSDLDLNKLRQQHSAGSFFHHVDRVASASRISSGLIIGTPPSIHENNVSCLLSIGNASHNRKKTPRDVVEILPKFVLFGKPILTEKDMMLSNSKGGVCEKLDDTKDQNSGAAAPINLNVKVSAGAAQQLGGLETTTACVGGHCKVFMESEDIGRTLNLSVLGSYEELHRKLADMFGIHEKLDLTTHVLYRDSTGTVRHTGDEPFGDFTRTARRLTILMDPASEEDIEG